MDKNSNSCIQSGKQLFLYFGIFHPLKVIFRLAIDFSLCRGVIFLSFPLRTKMAVSSVALRRRRSGVASGEEWSRVDGLQGVEGAGRSAIGRPPLTNGCRCLF